ncbi:MAG: S41 family peptidase [Bacteroidota bacterium]
MKRKIIIPIVGIFLLVSSAFTTMRSDFFEIAKQIEIFTTLYKEVNMNYVEEINPAELMNTAIVAMLEDLDPYTKFYNEQDVQKARIQQSAASSGIGASIKATPEKIIITEIVKDAAADKAGLKIGDEIIQIGDVLVADFNEDATELLKGSPGSEVEIVYNRQSEEKTTTLERINEETPAVPFYELLKDETGYIVLSQFTRSASSEVEKAVKDLKEQGAKKLILDLRNNPGGLLTEAVNVTNIFVPKDVRITYTKSAIEKYNRTYNTQNRPVDTEIPLVVLINEKSASASEIVSGSIQDLDRGVVIGARSFGKGLVQRPKNLSYGTSAKITISRYYTPSGRCIQALNYKDGEAIRNDSSMYNEFSTKNGRKVYDGGGIAPDIEIESAKTEGLTKALLEKDVLFDFATDYYYNNNLSSLDQFKWTENDWKKFVKFVSESDFTYETKTEKELEKLQQIASNENLSTIIEDELEALQKSLQQEKERGFDRYREQISTILKDEIIKRYFYNEGVYRYYTQESETVNKAQEILSKAKRYDKILQP